MNKKNIFVVVLLCLALFLSGSNAAVSEVPFIIDELNNTIIGEDSDIWFSTDYIKTGSGWIYPEIKYINLPGGAADIDVAFGVNESEMVFTKGEYYSPHYEEWESLHLHDFYNVTIVGVYTGDDFDYGNSYNTYKYIITHDVDNETMIDRITSNVSFDSYQQYNDYYMITWHTDESGIVDWLPIPPERITVEEIEYDNKTKWYIVKDVSVVELELNRLRIWMEIKRDIGPRSYKYDFATKLSSDTLQEAVVNDRLKLVDPFGDATNFNSTWNTALTSAGSSNSTSIKLPLVSVGTYDFTVWWGDGNSDHITAYNQANVTHDYGVEGTYDVVIDGTIYGFRFNNGTAGEDKLKITNITNWGNLRLGNLNGYFYGCSNLNVGATDTLDLTGTTTFAYAFRGASSLTTLNTSNWDTSKVTTFYYAFRDTSSLTTLDTSNWDTSKVTTFAHAFYGASSLTTLNTSNWDTRNVTTFYYAFYGASSLTTLNTSNWDTRNVTTFYYAFYGASSLTTLNTTNWDTRNVNTFAYAFYSASSLTILNTTNWDTRKVTTFGSTFRGMLSLTEVTGIGNLNVSTSTYFSNMFNGVTLNTSNYDELLIGWASLPTLSPNEAFHGGNSKYSCAANDSWNVLTDTWGWTIIDGGLTGGPCEANPAPYIALWQNNKTSNNTLDFTINTSESVLFNATANQTIVTWHWPDPLINYDNITLNWSTAGLKTVIVNATNANGTSNSITWNVTVVSLEDTSFTVSIPAGETQMNYTAITSKDTHLEPSGQDVDTSFFNVTNTGNIIQSFRCYLNSSITNVNTYTSLASDFSSPVEITTTQSTVIITDLGTTTSEEVWIYLNLSTPAPGTVIRTMTINSS